MKRSIIIIGLVVFTIPCAAQWKNTNFGWYGSVLAFGVHDTSFFLSDAIGSPAQLVYRYTNPGWAGSDHGIDSANENVTMFASLGRYFFAGCTTNTNRAAGLFRSSNNGVSWSELQANAPAFTNGTYLFGNSLSSAYRSRDSGNTWQDIPCPIASSYASIGICIFANSGDTILRSLDTGNTWAKISPPITGAVTAMGSTLLIPNGSKLAISTDSGSQWNTVTVDSVGEPKIIYCLATDGKNLFVGTATGILVSTDTGKSWVPKNDSISYQDIYHDSLTDAEEVLAIGVFDTLVFADVFYNRSPFASAYYLFVRPISELTKPDSPASVVQQTQPGDTLAVYPNPLTNTARIAYSIAEDSRVNIVIFDALGRTMSNPVAGVEPAGAHEITFDAQALPSGVYWCHFTAGSVERSVKLMINH